MSGQDIEIFDVNFALNQFSGNRSLLIQILEKFTSQYIHFHQQIVNELEEKNFHSAKQKVHTIKGVSGNLGMQALHFYCKELESQDWTQLPADVLEQFLDTLGQTLQLVEDYKSNELKDEEVIPEAIHTSSVRDELIAALKRNEFISDSKMKTYMSSINISTDNKSQLQQAIENFDYTKALQIIQ